MTPKKPSDIQTVNKDGEDVRDASSVLEAFDKNYDLEYSKVPELALRKKTTADALAKGGKDAWIALFNDWLEAKIQHRDSLAASGGKEEAVQRMTRDIRAALLDIGAYESGMRPAPIYARHFPTPWWWKGMNLRDWANSGACDWVWSYLKSKVYDPYLVFAPDEAVPGNASSLDTMKSVVLLANRKQWDSARAMLSAGSDLATLANGGVVPMEPVGPPHPFLGSMDEFEVLFRAHFTIEDREHEVWQLQGRLVRTYDPTHHETIGVPIRVVTRKEDDGSWKVTTDFIGSDTMSYLGFIVNNNWTSGWRIDQDGVYLISPIAEESIALDSPGFTLEGINMQRRALSWMAPDTTTFRSSTPRRVAN